MKRQRILILSRGGVSIGVAGWMTAAWGVWHGMSVVESSCLKAAPHRTASPGDRFRRGPGCTALRGLRPHRRDQVRHSGTSLTRCLFNDAWLNVLGRVRVQMSDLTPATYDPGYLTPATPATRKLVPQGSPTHSCGDAFQRALIARTSASTFCRDRCRLVRASDPKRYRSSNESNMEW